MPLPRLQLAELEDQPWFPNVLRRGLTDYLAEITTRTGPYAAAIPKLAAVLASHPTPRIRDLCSGGGGPWPELFTLLQTQSPALHLELSDAFPNPTALERFAADPRVTYFPEPRRATDADASAAPIVTMFSAFHHFAPDDATTILRHISTNRTTFAMFEATHRSVKALAAMCLVPLAVLVLTPMIRPVRWWRLLFTYVLPIVPVAAWWDGTVSCLRTYRPSELLQLTRALPAHGMHWEAGEIQLAGAPLAMTYLIGRPVSHADGDASVTP